jgi:hypothetical protein
MRAIPTRFCGFLILSVYLAGCNSGYKVAANYAGGGTQISISPTGAMAGSPDFTLTITGSNGQFYNSTHNLSQAVWFVNGTGNVLRTTFVSNTMLTAVIPAAFLSNPVTAQVFVETGGPKGSHLSVASNPIFFDVTPGPPGPQISVSPTSVQSGGPDLTLTITGVDGQFDNAAHNLSRAVWSVNGIDTVLTTTFVNSAMLTAVVPASLTTVSTYAEVSVETGDPAGPGSEAKSSSITFSVSPDSPWGY